MEKVGWIGAESEDSGIGSVGAPGGAGDFGGGGVLLVLRLPL